jgi:hypothetical protein
MYVCVPVHIIEHLPNFHETWYDYYAGRTHHKALPSNIPQSVIIKMTGTQFCRLGELLETFILAF